MDGAIGNGWQAPSRGEAAVGMREGTARGADRAGFGNRGGGQKAEALGVEHAFDEFGQKEGGDAVASGVRIARKAFAVELGEELFGLFRSNAGVARHLRLKLFEGKSAEGHKGFSDNVAAKLPH